LSQRRTPQKQRPARRQERTSGSRAFERRARAAQVQLKRKESARIRSRPARDLWAQARGLLRSVPRVAWICALVAIMNAICWSIVMPAFQATDEPDHFAYVKQLAETASLPTSGDEAYETNVELVTLLNQLGYPHLRQQPRGRGISSAAGQEGLEQMVSRLRAATNLPKGSYAAGSAKAQPPLYYALEAVPYSLANNALTRLQLMRLLSALMAGFTALFVYLFVREALPAEPWAWTASGLAASLVPLLGFISGAVNPDALLFAVSAALFYLLARGFRRGLTLRLSALIGATLALGVLTKLNFIGLVPGALLGLLLLSLRARRELGRAAWLRLGLALGVVLAPVVLYGLVNVASGHPTFGIISAFLNDSHLTGRELSYIWQLFLPRLPGMNNDFPGLFTTQQLWFNGYVGLYGWLDTTFPVWVYNVALVPLGAIALLFARGVVGARAVLRARIGEGVVYLLMAAGLLAMVGAASYTTFPSLSATFAEPRYMLPLLALFAAAIALAVRGAGRRFGPAVGVLIVVLFLAHDIFSLLLVAQRYYS
jgi:Predicted membrane protein (DUF2142)